MNLQLILLATPFLFVGALHWLITSDQRQELEADLSYGDTINWQLQSADTGIQWKITEDGYYWLRSVDRAAGHIVIAGVIEGSFVAQASWFVDCVPGTVAETSQIDEGGQNFLLVCDQVEGLTYLRATSFWQEYSLNAPLTWRADFDGFAVDQDFREWDWERPKRFITLSRATTEAE